MSDDSKKESKKIIIREDLEKAVTHSRTKPTTKPPTQRLKPTSQNNQTTNENKNPTNE